MSRRVSRLGLVLVLAIWCGVLLSPELRLLLRAQAAPQWPIFLRIIGVKDEGFARVLREHPNDPRVLAYEIEHYVPPEDLSYPPKKTTEDYRKVRLRNADRLIEKFPRETWLIQSRLLLTLRTRFTLNGAEGKVAPKYPAYQDASELSPEETRRALKVAERGARLDPQNTFYDWMRAAFLFSLHRDEEAMQALDEGARKEHYDDGILRDIQNRDAVRALQSPLLWEDRVSIMSEIALPQFSVLRLTSYAALSRAVLAEEKGDHKRALEIYGAQMNLLRVLRRDSKRPIYLLIGSSMESAVWDTPPRERQARLQAARRGQTPPRYSKTSSLDREKRNNYLATNFAVYARRYGRSDLATQALSDARAMNYSPPMNPLDDDWFGLSTNVVRPMFQLHWANAILLRAIMLSTLAWLFLSAALLNVRHRAELSRTSVLDISSAALFSIAACAVAFITTLRLNPNWMDFIWWPEQNFFSGSEETATNTASKFLIWLPLILAFLYCSVVMLWRGRKSTLVVDEDDDLPIFNWPKAERIFIRLTFGVIMLLLSWTWWSWLGAQDFIDGVTFPGMFLPILIGWISYRTLERLLARRPTQNIVYGFAWSQSTLGAMVVVGSIAYLVCALLALPLRREADARMDEYIAKGEVALMREGINK